MSAFNQEPVSNPVHCSELDWTKAKLLEVWRLLDQMTIERDDAIKMAIKEKGQRELESRLVLKLENEIKRLKNAHK